MDAENRREGLIKLLRKAGGPVTGTELAGRFSVSRQVIVQDIAILRARGEQVLATPQGYLVSCFIQKPLVHAVIACRHNREDIEDELSIIIDLGGKVLDVIIEHPLYGDLRGNLMIANRDDLFLFLERMNSTEANPLSELTGGVHLHTIETADKSVLEQITASLRQSKYLIE